MDLLAYLVLGLFLLLVGLVLLVVLVPVHFAARGVFTERRVDALAWASWGAGLVRAEATPAGGDVRLFGRPVYHFTYKGGPPKEKKKDEARPRKPARRSPGWRFFVRVARRILRSLRLRARVWGRIGTGDPADTAAVFHALVVSQRLFPGVDTRSLRVDWIGPAVDLEGQVDGRLWPAAVLWIVGSEYISARRRRHAREVGR